jgi:hypothetical protein
MLIRNIFFKYAFFVLAFVLSSLPSSYARTIDSFNDSLAITAIAQFMLDNAEDMPASNRISDARYKINDKSSCEVVSPSDALKEVESIIKSILRFFPDEELPVEEAITDLKNYLGSDSLTKCTFNKTNQYKTHKVQYFSDAGNVIHLRVDTITLVNP